MRTPNFTNNSSSLSISGKLRLSILSALVFFLGLGSVWGQSTNLVSWDFTPTPSVSNANYATNTTNQNGARTTALTNVTLSNISINGSGVSGVTANTFHRTTGWPTSSSTSHYLQFSITLTAGETFANQVCSVAVGAQVNNTSTAARDYTVTYGYGSSPTFATATNGAVTATGTSTTNTTNITIPAPGNTTTTLLTVRILVHGSSSSTGNFRIATIGLTGYTPLTSSPAINTSAATLPSFISSAVSTPSAEQSFSVSGTNLTNNITITPPTGYQVSTTSGSGFGSSVVLTHSGGTVASTTIYARFNPTALADQIGGNIECASNGATTQNVAVTGEVTNLSIGAIAFIAFQGATTDLYRIVALQDIPANTRIWFTDKAWDGNGGTLAFTTGEGNNVWTNTTGSTITAGTVIQFDAAGAATVGTGGLSSGLGTAGEQLFAYQGTLTSPTFVAGYTSGTVISSGIPTASGTSTWVPANLTDGTNFVALGGITFGSSYVTVGTHNRTLAEHRTHIHTIGSLTTGNTSTTTDGNWPTYTFNFLPDEPTTQPSFSAATSVGNNQMTINFSGGNGTSYMVVMREASAVTATPTDATNYSAVSGTVNFSTATELSAGQRIVYNGTTSGTSVTVTNLSPGTTYHYAIYAYNGTSTTANFFLTSPGTGSQLTTGSANSNVSDIIIHSSFTEPSNIAYHSYQENSNLTELNSIEVARFSLRDGGATTDADANSTTLNAISFTITNHAVLRRLALYNGATELGEVAVSSGSASFSSLTLAAADNGTQTFSLRASFAETVTDNTQFSFAVSSAITDPAGSTFAAANAGAATSLTTGDRNKIEVTATLLAFVQPPSNVSINTAISPAPTVSANDGLGNRDLDYTTDMTATTTGTFGSATTTVTPVSGLGTFSNLQFSAAATGRTIAVTSGSLTASGNSSSFDVNGLLNAGDLAIIGYGSTGTDKFAFLLLSEVPSSTVLNFTDNAWTGSALNSNENTLVWTSPGSTLSAGTVVTITSTASVSSGHGSATGTINGLAGGGDQVLCYRGTSGSPTFICAFSSSAWLTTGSVSNNTSYLPSGLTAGVNASAATSTFDNGYYNNILAGPKDVIASLINTTANWTTSASSQTFPAGYGNGYVTLQNSATLSANATITNLPLGSGETFVIGSNTLTLNGTISGSGQIDASSGTVAFGNATDLSFPASVFLGNIATLSKSSGAGTLTLNDNLSLTNLNTSVSTGAVILAANKQLTIGGSLTNNGTLTLENGATLVQEANSTASTATNNGYVVKQVVTGAGGSTPNGRSWYLGAPVSGATSNVIAPSASGNLLYHWNASAPTPSWAQVTAGAGSSLEVGKGYLIRMGAASTTLNFAANTLNNAPNVSPLTLPCYRQNSTVFQGFNLVSNPFPSYLNWNDVHTANASAFENTIWYRIGNGSGTMVFDTYVAGGVGTNNYGGAEVSSYIPPMQAFWVRLNSSVTPGSSPTNLSLTNGMRSHYAGGAGAGLKSNIQDLPAFVRLNLLQDNKKDQVIVYMRPEAQNQYDMYDAEKMFLTNYPQIYTKIGDKKLVINGMKNNKNQTVVPLYLEIPSTGVYVLNTEEFNIESGLILLEDKQEGVIQDLTINDNYVFYANSGVLTNRFFIRFQLPDPGISATGPSNNWVESQVYQEGGEILISTNGKGKVIVSQDFDESPQVQALVQITDASGKQVFNGAFEGAAAEFELQDVQNGIYFVRVELNGKVEVKKIIVQL